MKDLIIQSPPTHSFSAFIMRKEDVDFNWYNVFHHKEIEAEIDGKRAIIEIHDIHQVPFVKLRIVQFILKMGFGVNAEQAKELLLKKYGKSIKHATIFICLYKIIEVV